MAARVSPFCAFCGQGNHALCTGHGVGAACECGARDHDPTVEVAAAMRVYQAPDRRGAPVEVLATEYRRGRQAIPQRAVTKKDRCSKCSNPAQVICAVIGARGRATSAVRLCLNHGRQMLFLDRGDLKITYIDAPATAVAA